MQARRKKTMSLDIVVESSVIDEIIYGKRYHLSKLPSLIRAVFVVAFCTKTSLEIADYQ